MMTQHHKTILEVVLKIAGRCNIDCKYCYMFNKGNDDYLDQPSYMNEATLDATIDYILQGIIDLNISGVIVIFHGGEPLMLKKERFEQLCQKLRVRLIPHLQALSFSIQTNAILLTPDWIKLLAKYKVNIGISMDGPQEYNDIARVDHKGLGTYQKTVDGLRLAQRAATHGLANEPGILCVVDHNFDGRKVYRHFVDELNINWISFLVPLETIDTWNPEHTQAISNYLMGVLEEWVSDDNPDIKIRQFSHFLNFLISGKTDTAEENSTQQSAHVIIPIATNGDISVDDESKPINFGQAIKNVRTSTLLEHVNSDSYLYLKSVSRVCPAACAECEWVGYCRGGAQNQQATNRFSHINGFNNKSIFCDIYKRMYGALTKYMLDRGMPETQVVDALYAAAKEVVFAELPPYMQTGKRRFFMKTIPKQV